MLPGVVVIEEYTRAHACGLSAPAPASRSPLATRGAGSWQDWGWIVATLHRDIQSGLQGVCAARSQCKGFGAHLLLVAAVHTEVGRAVLYEQWSVTQCCCSIVCLLKVGGGRGQRPVLLLSAEAPHLTHWCGLIPRPLTISLLLLLRNTTRPSWANYRAGRAQLMQ